MKTNKKRIPHLKQLDQSNQQINPDSVKKERGNTKEKTPNNSNQKEKSGKGNIPQMPSIKKGKYQKKTTTDISSINVQQQFEQPLEQASNALQQKQQQEMVQMRNFEDDLRDYKKQLAENKEKDPKKALQFSEQINRMQEFTQKNCFQEIDRIRQTQSELISKFGIIQEKMKEKDDLIIKLGEKMQSVEMQNEFLDKYNDRLSKEKGDLEKQVQIKAQNNQNPSLENQVQNLNSQIQDLQQQQIKKTEVLIIDILNKKLKLQQDENFTQLENLIIKKFEEYKQKEFETLKIEDMNKSINLDFVFSLLSEAQIAFTIDDLLLWNYNINFNNDTELDKDQTLILEKIIFDIFGDQTHVENKKRITIQDIKNLLKFLKFRRNKIAHPTDQLKQIDKLDKIIFEFLRPDEFEQEKYNSGLKEYNLDISKQDKKDKWRKPIFEYNNLINHHKYHHQQLSEEYHKLAIGLIVHLSGLEDKNNIFKCVGKANYEIEQKMMKQN